MAGQVFERIAARHQQVERFAVGGHVHAERAEDAQFLVHDVIGVEAWRLWDATCAGQHDGAARTGELDRLCESGRGLGRDIDHDVCFGAGGVAQRPVGIIDRDIHRQVGAERRGKRQTLCVTFAQAGHHDESRSRLLRCCRRAQSTHARAQDGHDIAGLGIRDFDRPADSRSERIEQRCRDRVELVGDCHQHRVGSQIQVRGVAAAETRWRVGVGEADHGGQAVALAAPVEPCSALVAVAARQEHLDCHSLPRADAPPLGRGVTQLLDHADHFVPGDERVPVGDVTRVLLVVGAAQAAGLDPQQTVVGADVGQVEAALLERTRLGEDQPGCRGHACPP